MNGASPSRVLSALLIVAAVAAVSAPVGLMLRVVAAGVPDLAVDGDHALIDLATRQAADGQRLLGPYSRLGFHHPGPAPFYLYAPFHALSGGRYLALCLAALGIGSVSIVAILGVCAGGGSVRRVAAAAAAVGLLLVYLEPSVLASPWNPHVLLLPLLATFVALGAVAAGRAHWLPIAVVLGSFAVQSHLAVALPVAVAVAVALLGLATACDGSSDSLRAPAAASLLLLVPLWLPVAVEAFAAGGGNPIEIWSYLRAPRSTIPLGEVSETVLTRLGAPLLTPWGATARTLPSGAAGTAGPWPGLALLAFAAILALVNRDRHHRIQRAWAAIAAASSLVASLSLSAAGTSAEDHVVRWIAVLGILALLAVATALPRPSRRTRLLDPALLALLLTLAVASWVQVARWGDIPRLLAAPATERNRVLGDAAAAACAEAGAARATLVIGDPADWGVAAAVSARLADHGLETAIDRRWQLLFDTAARPAADDLRIGLLREPLAPILASRDGLHLVPLEVGVPPPHPVPLSEAATLAWLLDGFGGVEGAEADAFRWSAGDRSRLLFRMPEKTTDGVLALELQAIRGGPSAQAVTVEVDGRPSGTAELDPSARHWYRFRIPRGRAGRTVEVEIRYAWTVRPRDIGRSVEDPRELAVRWFRLALEPVVDPGLIPAQPPVTPTSAGTPAAASADTRAAGTTPATATTLSRPPPPATTVTHSLPTPRRSASSSSTARLARPRSGAARTSTLRAPPCAPSTRSVRPPGFTRSLRPEPSGRGDTVTVPGSTGVSPATG